MLAGFGTAEGTVIIADHQTSGKGRHGRVWHAEAGQNLLFTIVLRPNLQLKQVGLLTYYISVAVSAAVERTCGINCECKWPNDLLINGKKFCGILIESSFQNLSLDFAAVGIGLNVNQKIFNPEIREIATSLSLECNRDFEREELFQKIMEYLEYFYEDVRNGNFVKILDEWKRRTSIFGKEIIITQNGSNLKATAIDLTPDGGLIIYDGNSQSIIYSGDIIINHN